MLRNMKRSFVVRTACALIVLFSLQEAAAYAVAPALAPSPRSASADLLRLQFSPSVAVVESRFEGKGPAILLIQDAHTNPSAQLNIAKTLEDILKKSDVRQVFLEAGRGNLSLADLQKDSDEAARERVGLGYVNKGLLQGPEYASLTLRQDFELWGVENRALYTHALHLYCLAVDRRESALLEIYKYRQTSDALGQKILSPQLLILLQKQEAYLSGQLALTDYADALEHAGSFVAAGTFLPDQIKSLKNLKRKEGEIDFESASRQFYRLSARAGGELWAAPPKRLSGHMTEAEGAALAATRQYLDTIPGPEKSSYAALDRYLRYRQECEALAGLGFLTEFDRWQKSVLEGMAASADEKRMLDAIEQIRDWHALVSMKAGPEVFERFKRMADRDAYGPTEVAAFFNRRILDLDVPRERVLFQNRALESAIWGAARFYRLAEMRDEAMLRNALARMRSASSRSAVLVVGGFHAEHLKKLFRSRGMSYLSIVPRVSHETDISRYERLLLSRARPAEPGSAGSARALNLPQVKSGGPLDYDALALAVRTASNPPGASREPVPPRTAGWLNRPAPKPPTKYAASYLLTHQPSRGARLAESTVVSEAEIQQAIAEIMEWLQTDEQPEVVRAKLRSAIIVREPDDSEVSYVYRTDDTSVTVLTLDPRIFTALIKDPLRPSRQPWRFQYVSSPAGKDRFGALSVIYGDGGTPNAIRSDGQVDVSEAAPGENYAHLNYVPLFGQAADNVRLGTSPFSGAAAHIVTVPEADRRQVLKSWSAALGHGQLIGRSMAVGPGYSMTSGEMDLIFLSATEGYLEGSFHREQLAFGAPTGEDADAVDEVRQSIDRLRTWFASPHPGAMPRLTPFMPAVGISPKYGGIERDRQTIGVGTAAAITALLRPPLVDSFIQHDPSSPSRSKVFIGFLGGAKIHSVIRSLIYHHESVSRDNRLIFSFIADGKRAVTGGKDGIPLASLRQIVSKTDRLNELSDEDVLRVDRALEVREIHPAGSVRRDLSEIDGVNVLVVDGAPAALGADVFEKFMGELVIEASPYVLTEEAKALLAQKGIAYIPYTTINIARALIAAEEIRTNWILGRPDSQAGVARVPSMIISATISNFYEIIYEIGRRTKAGEKIDLSKILEQVRDANRRQIARSRKLYDLVWSESDPVEDPREGVVDPADERIRDRILAELGRQRDLAAESNEYFDQDTAVAFLIFDQAYGENFISPKEQLPYLLRVLESDSYDPTELLTVIHRLSSLPASILETETYEFDAGEFEDESALKRLYQSVVRDGVLAGSDSDATAEDMVKALNGALEDPLLVRKYWKQRRGMKPDGVRILTQLLREVRRVTGSDLEEVRRLNYRVLQLAHRELLPGNRYGNRRRVPRDLAFRIVRGISRRLNSGVKGAEPAVYYRARAEAARALGRFASEEPGRMLAPALRAEARQALIESFLNPSEADSLVREWTAQSLREANIDFTDLIQEKSAALADKTDEFYESNPNFNPPAEGLELPDPSNTDPGSGIDILKTKEPLMKGDVQSDLIDLARLEFELGVIYRYLRDWTRAERHFSRSIYHQMASEEQGGYLPVITHRHIAAIFYEIAGEALEKGAKKSSEAYRKPLRQAKDAMLALLMPDEMNPNVTQDAFRAGTFQYHRNLVKFLEISGLPGDRAKVLAGLIEDVLIATDLDPQLNDLEVLQKIPDRAMRDLKVRRTLRAFSKIRELTEEYEINQAYLKLLLIGVSRAFEGRGEDMVALRRILRTTLASGSLFGDPVYVVQGPGFPGAEELKQAADRRQRTDDHYFRLMTAAESHEDSAWSGLPPDTAWIWYARVPSASDPGVFRTLAIRPAGDSDRNSLLDHMRSDYDALKAMGPGRAAMFVLETLDGQASNILGAMEVDYYEMNQGGKELVVGLLPFPSTRTDDPPVAATNKALLSAAAAIALTLEAERIDSFDTREVYDRPKMLNLLRDNRGGLTIIADRSVGARLAAPSPEPGLKIVYEKSDSDTDEPLKELYLHYFEKKFIRSKGFRDWIRKEFALGPKDPARVRLTMEWNVGEGDNALVSRMAIRAESGAAAAEKVYALKSLDAFSPFFMGYGGIESQAESTRRFLNNPDFLNYFTPILHHAAYGISGDWIRRLKRQGLDLEEDSGVDSDLDAGQEIVFYINTWVDGTTVAESADRIRQEAAGEQAKRERLEQLMSRIVSDLTLAWQAGDGGMFDMDADDIMIRSADGGTVMIDGHDGLVRMSSVDLFEALWYLTDYLDGSGRTASDLCRWISAGMNAKKSAKLLRQIRAGLLKNPHHMLRVNTGPSRGQLAEEIGRFLSAEGARLAGAVPESSGSGMDSDRLILFLSEVADLLTARPDSTDTVHIPIENTGPGDIRKIPLSRRGESAWAEVRGEWIVLPKARVRAGALDGDQSGIDREAFADLQRQLMDAAGQKMDLVRNSVDINRPQSVLVHLDGLLSQVDSREVRDARIRSLGVSLRGLSSGTTLVIESSDPAAKALLESLLKNVRFVLAAKAPEDQNHVHLLDLGTLKRLRAEGRAGDSRFRSIVIGPSPEAEASSGVPVYLDGPAVAMADVAGRIDLEGPGLAPDFLYDYFKRVTGYQGMKQEEFKEWLLGDEVLAAAYPIPPAVRADLADALRLYQLSIRLAAQSV